MTKRLLFTGLISALLLSGCLSLPTLRQASHDLPTQWPAEWPKASLNATAPDAWWQAYQDAALNTLIEEALRQNSDVRQAMARIDEARGAVGIARSAQQLQVELSSDAMRSRRSQSNAVVMPGNPVSNHFNLSFLASYEIDLWGRLQAGNDIARAQLLASAYARDATRLAVAHAVTQTWFSLRALVTQRTLLVQTRANRDAALELHRLRLTYGLTTALGVHQLEAERADLDARLAQLNQAEQEQRHVLAVLLGRSPREMLSASLPAATPLALEMPPPMLPEGLPSELLKRRPDLQAAEQTFSAAQARMLQAKSGIYPSLSLTAALGAESARLSNLFSGPAAIWSVGASIAQTVFNGGRTEATLEAEDARQLQALIRYEDSVRTAFREVLDALVAHRQSQAWRQAEQARETALKAAETLALQRYAQGLENHLSVLDAQRNLLAAQLGQIDALHAQLAAGADLAKALGGGWQAKEPPN